MRCVTLSVWIDIGFYNGIVNCLNIACNYHNPIGVGCDILLATSGQCGESVFWGETTMDLQQNVQHPNVFNYNDSEFFHNMQGDAAYFSKCLLTYRSKL